MEKYWPRFRVPTPVPAPVLILDLGLGRGDKQWCTLGGRATQSEVTAMVARQTTNGVVAGQAVRHGDADLAMICRLAEPPVRSKVHDPCPYRHSDAHRLVALHSPLPEPFVLRGQMEAPVPHTAPSD